MTKYQPNPDLHDPLCKLTDRLIHKAFERDAVLQRRKRQKTGRHDVYYRVASKWWYPLALCLWILRTRKAYWQRRDARRT